jgi:glycosyltransferase involved in cell wall biosynthesis
MHSILCINTGGIGDLHGLRMRRLVEDLNADLQFLDLDRSHSRRQNTAVVNDHLASRDWDLVYMESTGIAAGLPLIWAARRRGLRYVVSSGDPIGGYFRVVEGALQGFLLGQYEKQLYRHSSGFIGWTPYLTGAALNLGAPRGVTVEGAVDCDLFRPLPEPDRRAVKTQYGLSPDHLVAGIVGSLKWTERQQYCYGLELIEMLQYLQRPDVSVLIVGDGTGRETLQDRVPHSMRKRVVFTGRVPETEVATLLNAMDIGFITQTLDELGSFRLTTKLPEYLAAGLPVAMSPIPGFFDYASEAGWALPTGHPADPAFHRGCARWIDSVSWQEVESRRRRAPDLARSIFDYSIVRPRFTRFVGDLLAMDQSPQEDLSHVDYDRTPA